MNKKKILTTITNKLGVELRHYQLGAINKMFRNKRGKIIHATGTGKSFTFGFYLGTELKTTSPGVHIVLAHRIDLLNQLIEDIYMINTANHIQCGYSILHSGNFKDNELVKVWTEAGKPWLYREVGSSCSYKFHKTEAQKSLDGGYHHIIFGTYHSAEDICNIGLPIDNVICDEAHEMASEGRNELVTCFRPKKQFFFTATEKHTDNKKSFGMNNKDFGKVIHKYDSQDAIKEKVLTNSRIVEITCDDIVDEENVLKSSGKIIFKGYDVLNKQNIIPMMLVTAKGTKHMEMIKNSKEWKELIKNGVQCFDMSSELGRNHNNKKYNKNKQEFLKEITTAAEQNKPLILLQIRMADTGINIKPLNSMLSFKGLGKIARQQTYGRISRVCEGKEWAWVLIPSISLIEQETAEQMKSFIKWLRDINPNYDPIEKFNDDTLLGMGGSEDPEIINNSKKKSKLKQLIDELNFEIEQQSVQTIDDVIEKFTKNGIVEWNQFVELRNNKILNNIFVPNNVESIFGDEGKTKLYKFFKVEEDLSFLQD
jgi:superfamily II DNA or RNA helicase